MFHFSVTNVWTADDRKNGRNVGKPIRAPSPISQTLNNNAVKAYRGTPQNPGGGSPSVFTFIQTLRIWQIFCVKSECDIRYYISRLNHLTIFYSCFIMNAQEEVFPLRLQLSIPDLTGNTHHSIMTLPMHNRDYWKMDVIVQLEKCF